MPVLPWHVALVEDGGRAGRRCPHLLIHGRDGIGMLELGARWRNRLLCESGARRCCPLRRMSGMRLVLRGNHPDFREVRPEVLDEAERACGRGRETARRTTKESFIKIDQIHCAHRRFDPHHPPRWHARTGLASGRNVENQKPPTRYVKTLENRRPQDAHHPRHRTDGAAPKPPSRTVATSRARSIAQAIAPNGSRI